MVRFGLGAEGVSEIASYAANSHPTQPKLTHRGERNLRRGLHVVAAGAMVCSWCWSRLPRARPASDRFGCRAGLEPIRACRGPEDHHSLNRDAFSLACKYEPVPSAGSCKREAGRKVSGRTGERPVSGSWDWRGLWTCRLVPCLSPCAREQGAGVICSAVYARYPESANPAGLAAVWKHVGSEILTG
jgi:hypothetical protein